MSSDANGNRILGSSGRVLGASIAIVMVLAGATLGIVLWSLRAIEPAARRLTERAGPDLRDLTSARRELRQLEVFFARSVATNRPERIAQLTEARERLGALVESYTRRRHDEEDAHGAARMMASMAHLDRTLANASSATTLGSEAQEHVVDAVHIAADALDTELWEREQHAVLRVEHAALQTNEALAKSTDRAVFLSVASIVAALATAALAWRRLSNYERLLDEHRRTAELRAGEFEQFASRVAHDIRSPLSTVRLSIQQAMRIDPGNEKLTQYLGKADTAVTRIVRVVEDLLEFARAGAEPDPDARSDLKAVIDDLQEAVGQAAAGANLTLDVPTIEPTFVRANEGIVTSIVHNLVLNAVKYASDSPEGFIRISVSDRGTRVRVAIEDNGPGVAPISRDRIFEPFFRAAGSEKPGVGLGLATVKRLCAAHGGSAGYEPRPGGGSRFWFELPKAAGARGTSDR